MERSERNVQKRAEELYAMLTIENREKVIRYVESLREAQCTPKPSLDSLK